MTDILTLDENDKQFLSLVMHIFTEWLKTEDRCMDLNQHKSFDKLMKILLWIDL